MNFYVSLVFLGIILVALSLVLVILDRKKAIGITRNFDEKKQELEEIINDAEQMIEELNKFSDYIVTQMDIKNEELRVNIRSADEEIKILAEKAQTIRTNAAGGVVAEERRMEYKPAAAVNGRMFDVDIAAGGKSGEIHTNVPASQPPKQTLKRNEKVIPIKNRYSEVLRLAETGLGELEIARTLNMGKGEVELILGLNKN